MQALSSVTPTLYPQLPIAKASAPPDGVPTDSVTLQSNPWPQMDRAGLLGASPAIGGPIGNSLSAATRQGLLDACTRLQDAGWTFEEQRKFHLPLVRAKYVPLSPQQIVDAIAQEPAHFKTRLNVSGHGQQHMQLQNLESLRELDAWYGVGDVAGCERLAAVKAFRSLEARDWKFEARDPNSDYYYYRGAPGAYNSFMALAEERGISARPPGKEAVGVRSDEELLALDYFSGSGQDHGLKQPAVAARLKQMEGRGYRFNFGGGNQTYDAQYSYNYLKNYGNRNLRVGHADNVSVAVDDVATADPDKVAAHIEKAEKIYQRMAEPALSAVGIREGGSAFVDAVCGDDPKFSSEIRAAVLGELVRAGDGRYDGRNYMAQATEDMRHLCDLSSNPSELATYTNLFSGLMRAEGRNSAYNFKSAIADGLRSRTATEAEYQRLQPVLVSLISATGSTQAALEGIDLIRIPVGKETEAQRLELFTNIADRESEGTLGNTASDYRAVLVHRLPNEGLVEAGQRFCSILEALSLKRQQERAGEVFAVIGGGLQDGSFGSRSAQAVVEQFAQSFVMSKSVDDALHSVMGGRRGDSMPGPATVRSGDDCVVIGGIRVPKQG